MVLGCLKASEQVSNNWKKVVLIRITIAFCLIFIFAFIFQGGMKPVYQMKIMRFEIDVFHRYKVL